MYLFLAQNLQEIGQKKEMQALQSQINIFFSVYQSLATHIFEYFVRAHVLWSVSVDVAFYLMLGLGTQGHGFESTSLFGGDVSLSLQLCFWGGCGFDSTFFGGGCGFESFF